MIMTPLQPVLKEKEKHPVEIPFPPDLIEESSYIAPVAIILLLVAAIIIGTLLGLS